MSFHCTSAAPFSLEAIHVLPEASKPRLILLVIQDSSEVLLFLSPFGVLTSAQRQRAVALRDRDGWTRLELCNIGKGA